MTETTTEQAETRDTASEVDATATDPFLYPALLIMLNLRRPAHFASMWRSKGKAVGQ